MKKIITRLESQLEALRDLIQKREDKVYDMSARWQESEKCEEWEDKTQEIEAQADVLDYAIDELKELL
jgi:predicted nuclease with TOPRIM domain